MPIKTDGNTAGLKRFVGWLKVVKSNKALKMLGFVSQPNLPRIF
ncbi:hypothetical protein [Nostoc sp.]